MTDNLVNNITKESHDAQDEDENTTEKLNFFMLLMKKTWKGLGEFIFGASAIDVLIESDRYFELLRDFEARIQRLKNDIGDKMFQKKLYDVKMKFSAVLTIFDKVINGKDSFSTRRKRLDSLFYHCEEIILLIIDTKSVLYDKAHYCIEFISNFLVFHLGMLQIAEDDFGIIDYKERRKNALKFYPTLVKSYIDKAISVYVRSIVLKYHSMGSSFKEYEMIFNEITEGMIYRVNNTSLHPIWDGTTVKEMEKDKMFYSFKDKKLVPLKPSFLCSMDSPVLCRALRNGIALKLEDLFTDYIKNIEICISLLGINNKKEDAIPDDFSNDEIQNFDTSFSTICSDKDNEKLISVSQKYHEDRVERVDNLSQQCSKVKEQAQSELKNLEALYVKTVGEKIKSTDMSEKNKIKLKRDFISTLKDSDEHISSINKYLCFSVENQRFFNVSF